MSALESIEAVEWMTPKEVATIYKISVWTVYRGCAEGSLEHIGGGRRGTRIRIRSDHAAAWWRIRSDRSLF